jgi:hypothetical protein
MVIEPRGHRLELTADLVSGEEIEYPGLGRAFGALSAPVVAGLLWNPWLETKAYPKPPGHAREKSQFLKLFKLALHKAQAA